MTVSTTSNKVSFSANGSTTVFAYNFKIFADSDLTVIIRDADGAETTKTLTTHYTVSGAGSASGGNVTFTSGNTPANGETVVIQRQLTKTQGTDYVANDPFPAESHEDALDRLTFITQELQEEVDRSIKASVTNTISGAEFTVSATDRANKVFAFDGSGDLAVTQELGTFRGNWAASTAYAVRDLVKDTSTNNIFIVNTAHTSSGSQPLTSNANSAKYDLIVDAATATTAQTAAASSASSASTSASTATTKASEASTSAATASTQAGIATAKAVLTAADAVSTAADVVSTNADVVTTNADAATTTADRAQVNTDKGVVAADKATVAADKATVATDKAAAASSASSASTSASTATTKAAEASTSASNASTSETNSASSATASASSATAAAASQTAAAASAASAATAFDNFDDRFLGSLSSDPSTDNDGNALVTGALYFNTTANEMRVFDGGNFIAATSAGNVSLILYEYTATNGQTTFSGSDDNSATLSYTADNIQVVMNGVVLDPSDFTATNGTSVVLASGAALNDLVNIYAFKSFTTADMVSKSAGGTFAGAVGFSGGITGDVAFDTSTLKVDAANNRVGISTASPTAPLHLNTSASGDIAILNTSANSGTGLFINSQTANQIDVVGYDGSAANAVNIRSGGATGSGLNVNTSNNVGIGTTSPVSQLTLANTSDIVFTQNGYGISWGGDNGSPRIFGTSGGALSFKHGGGSTAVTIDTSGTVLVGSTSFSEDGSTNSIKIHPDEILTGTTSTSANTHLGFSNPNGRVGSIITNGSGTAFNTSSDYRLKENVADMTGAITRVKALAPKRFNFIADADRTVDGFLAHEAQAVVPEAVTGTKDEVDDDGNAVMQGIDQSKLVPLLTAALKESIAKIETLEAKVTALENA
jgi:hypothetical protein